MRQLTRTFASVLFTAALATAPAWAGIHYKAVTDNQDSKAGSSKIEVEGWVSGNSARVEIKDSNNPVMGTGTYLLTKDGSKTIYLVNPEEKTYAKWDVQAMLGALGSVMKGMGPLLKMDVSEPKVEKLAEEDGGQLLGLPTRHYKYRTSYNMTFKVFGMGQTSNVLVEQDIWSTDQLNDLALGAWLRSEPPTMGNEGLDRLIKSEMGKMRGYPLKTVTVTTNTPQKKGEKTVTRSTMQVTQLDTSATVPASRFEIPSGYQETQLLPMAGAQASEGQGGEEEQGGFGGLLRRGKKKDGGN